MEDEIQEVYKLFNEEQILEAGRKIKELGKLYIETKYNEDLSRIEVVRVIKEDIQLANQCLELLSDMDGWNLVKESEDIATFTKGSNDEFMVRAEMLLKHSVFPVLALFSETQLLSEWVPILDDARILGTPSMFRRIIHYFFKLPWPIENRDAVVSAAAIPIPENKSVLIILKSIERPEYLEVNIPEPSTVRMIIKQACLNITYVSDEETQISLIARCDIKLALIPVSVVNFATKHGVFYFMQQVRKMSDEYKGSKYEEIVESKPQYYGEIKNRFVRIFH